MLTVFCKIGHSVSCVSDTACVVNRLSRKQNPSQITLQLKKRMWRICKSHKQAGAELCQAPKLCCGLTGLELNVVWKRIRIFFWTVFSMLTKSTPLLRVSRLR